MSEKNHVPVQAPSSGAAPSASSVPSIQEQKAGDPGLFRMPARGDGASPILFVETMSVDNLLERAMLDLEAEMWQSAVVYADRALAVDPDCSRPWLVKLMADVKASTPEKLKLVPDPLENRPAYIRIMERNDDSVRSLVRDANAYICAHLDEIHRNELDEADRLISIAAVVPDLNGAREILDRLPSFPAADGLRKRLARETELLAEETYRRADQYASNYEWERAAALLESLPSLPKARIRLIDCREGQKLEQHYQEGVALHGKNQFREAAEVFRSLPGYRDSDLRLKRCSRMIRGSKVRAVGTAHTWAVVANSVLSAFMGLGAVISAPGVLLKYLFGFPVTVAAVVLTIIRSRYRPTKRMWIAMAAVMAVYLALVLTGVLSFGAGTSFLPSLIYLALAAGLIFT